ncbi:hypothetical protein L6164_010649 [Bauhinia variegata]|uniref:Uncharacterized protein n=1 Tax=Bauhinia variegata TaxID=167791 RepID=A0ACB9PMY7_BAUVA|nr:hypothetical protein L6164_010649 [Bauhinia variegata]
MRIRKPSLPPRFHSLFFFLTVFRYCFLVTRVSGECPINVTSYQYVAFGECGGVQESISNWTGKGNGFPSTLCCRDALTVLSQGLALHARASPQESLFVTQDEWQSCAESFHPQPGMSFNSCGFDILYSGSSKCSSTPRLRDIQANKSYQQALDKCSHFDQPFPQTCSECTDAILKVRDAFYELTDAKDNITDTERVVCGVAALVSVAAGKPEDPAVTDKFLRCFLSNVQNDNGQLAASSTKLVLNVFIAIVGISMMVFLVKYVSKKKRPKPVKPKEIETWSGLYWFSKAEIENAINHEDERKCLGRGSAGQVYKGVLPSGQIVAIKHLSKSNSTDSFNREVEGLSRLRHPNLVCLFGCCNEDGERYLVYEYCAAGNLAQHLLRRDSHLKWETRVKILRDCSYALKYLHHHMEGCVVHRDIKLTNILLTEKHEAKLSDFGLARILKIEQSKVFTDVRGTIGYMDPEYMSNAKLTCASDIYSFGIVILQILSGQKVIELDLDARDQLTRKARDVSMGKRPLEDFEDPRLNGQINKADFEAILQIAVLCVAKSSKGRPTIEVVFEELDKAYKNSTGRHQKGSSTPTSTSTLRSSELV